MKEHLIVFCCYLNLKKKEVAILSFVKLLVIEDSTRVKLYLAKEFIGKIIVEY